MGDATGTVHVVDDDEPIRQSVGFLLRKVGYAVETYAAAPAFLNAVSRETPGCVLLDVRMPEIDGLEVQARLARQGIAMPVVMLTGHGDVALAVRAIKAGAIQFLEKPFERSALLAAIGAALDQAARALHGKVAGADAVVRLAALTARERDVLGGMVLGRPNKLIAFELDIATRTVEVHRARLMDKLSARSLSDVLRIAFAAGWHGRGILLDGVAHDSGAVRDAERQGDQILGRTIGDGALLNAIAVSIDRGAADAKPDR